MTDAAFSPRAHQADQLGTLLARAELAVHALLPVVQVTGSWSTGYRVSGRIDPVVSGTIEEWTDAAHAVAELHAAVVAALSVPAVRDDLGPDDGTVRLVANTTHSCEIPGAHVGAPAARVEGSRAEPTRCTFCGAVQADDIPWCGSCQDDEPPLACGVCGHVGHDVIYRGWTDDREPMETCERCGGPDGPTRARGQTDG